MEPSIIVEAYSISNHICTGLLGRGKPYLNCTVYEDIRHPTAHTPLSRLTLQLTAVIVMGSACAY